MTNRMIRSGLATLALAGSLSILLAIAGRPCAEANSCVSQCRAAHSQCRIATRGSPSCDAQLQACLQGCIGSR